MIVFKRKLYDKMLSWKQENGTSALLIKGARRTGKSTLAENFAQQEYKSYILVDFSTVPPEVNELFNHIYDLDYFFLRLQVIYGVTLYERNSVIIFDEVQMQPLARQAIKHLVKDGRYDYIETGSLLSIKKNVKDIVIPSEETRITLYPMDYEEFCWAMDDKTSVDLIRQMFNQKKPLGDSTNRMLMRKFRLYMLVGGMPQAVNEYITKNNFESVDRIKRNILELYEEDFRKIDPLGRASLLFSAIPSQLNKNDARYKVSSVLENSRPSRLNEVIADMQDSMTVNFAYHADNPMVGMSMHKDINRYKMFLCDTGLFVTLAFKDKDFTENTIYNKLLSDKLSVDLGYVYENMIAQMLCASGHGLYYYTFPKENSTHNYEVDFLLTKNNKICPIEVKSSGYKTHKSLDAFSNKFSERVSEKYVISPKDLHKENDVLYIPVYMTMFL
ncbi:MAG: ATP-binding protein [Bacteroidales bacterium]|nr:ATP-binding protein [Bacteroidales bacterium]